MEGEAIGALSAVVVALVGAIGILMRNGKKNHHANPNFETLEVLMNQQLESQKVIIEKMDATLLALQGIQTTIQFCPTVQATRKGG